MDIPCDKHGSHKIWDMLKRWVEREGIRTREAYCPEDDRLTDPLACWTGSSWILLPGRGVKAAWCRNDEEMVPLDDVETVEKQKRNKTIVYAICPSCGAEIARRNRWRYWEPLYRGPEG